MTNPFDFFAVDLIIVVLSFDIVFFWLVNKNEVNLDLFSLKLHCYFSLLMQNNPMTTPFDFFAVDLILVVLYCLLLLFFVHQ